MNTSTFARTLSLLHTGVLAFTLCAVLELSFVAGYATAVSLIPIAATIVVIVVATPITDILQHPALFLARAVVCLFHVWVFALTLLTI